MVRIRIVLAAAVVLIVGTVSPAAADPTENTMDSLGLEAIVGMSAGDAWVSAYVQGYSVHESSGHREIVAATIFVDAPNLTMECFEITELGDVTIDGGLGEGSLAATLEGYCFDFATEESVPFAASFGLAATGHGAVRTRAGSFVDDGNRCVSRLRFRDAPSAGEMSFSAPNRSLTTSGVVNDESSHLQSTSIRCYPMNGTPPDDH